MEEECFAPCEKVPWGTWRSPDSPRGEVQWVLGSPKGARRRPEWVKMRQFEFHKNHRFELELASGESPGDVPVPLGCSWATLGNFEVRPKF